MCVSAPTLNLTMCYGRAGEELLPMLNATALRAPPANRLLAALPAKEYQRLLPQLEPVPLRFAQIIYNPGDTIRHVYFPNNAIVSLLAAEDHHASLEVGMIGNE